MVLPVEFGWWTCRLAPWRVYTLSLLFRSIESRCWIRFWLRSTERCTRLLTRLRAHMKSVEKVRSSGRGGRRRWRDTCRLFLSSKRGDPGRSHFIRNLFKCFYGIILKTLPKVHSELKTTSFEKSRIGNSLFSMSLKCWAAKSYNWSKSAFPTKTKLIKFDE